MNRQEIIDSIANKPEVSVLIIGGGVNGIGTFRDLAAQGVDVLLVEKDDFCGGASAASSHMLHGGIRYLENGEFRLVKEALTERNRMLHNAPHYSKPLPTTIPIFSWLSGMFNAPLKFLRLRDKPSERGLLVIKIGLMLYDLFTKGQQGLPEHRIISREESLRKRSKLNPDIIATAQYYDAWMPYPERICLEMIMDAEAENPNARAVNYMRVEGASGDTVRLHDELSGETLDVKPKLVINAAGPWIDFVNQAMGRSSNFIGGTKGSHLIVDNPELHQLTDGNEIFFENEDGRIVLFFPLLDKVLMGTTDIKIKDPEQAVCSDEEMDYILGMVQRVFPDLKLDRSQVVFTFCGVRPLPSSDAAFAGNISRDHSIQTIDPTNDIHFPIYSLVGGKWTTYRAFAEQTADLVLSRLSLPRKVSTEKMPIGGGKNFPKQPTEQTRWIQDLAQRTRITEERARTLFERYGTYAALVAEFSAAGQDEPLKHKPDYSRREIEFLTTREKIVHLDDLLLRRSLIAMLGFTTGDLLEEIAALMAGLLNWSEQEKRQEIERAVNLLVKRHRVAPEKLRPTSVAAV
jgi:glycerol-3-phosphate dehydrogenase